MNTKIIKKIATICLLLVILFGFYQVNKMNYLVQREIKINLIKHPENLPTNQVASATSFGFKNLRADLYWIDTIQYIG